MSDDSDSSAEKAPLPAADVDALAKAAAAVEEAVRKQQIGPNVQIEQVPDTNASQTADDKVAQTAKTDAGVAQSQTANVSAAVKPQSVPDACDAKLAGDARYVLREIARGDALAPEIYKAVQPLIAALSAAVSDYRVTPQDKQSLAMQMALTDLMAHISPITVQSLKDTKRSGTPRGRSSSPFVLIFAAIVRLFQRMLGHEPADSPSVADLFSDTLIWITCIVLAIAITCTALTPVPPPKTDDTQKPPGQTNSHPAGNPPSGGNPVVHPKPPAHPKPGGT
ncbi:MAG TPA: hypothetical protein VGG48_19790 [Rhizomicrobium sp.]|jgi:hypothetical protein